MFEKKLCTKQAAPVWQIDFPNLGQMGGCLCARRISMATQDVSDHRVEVVADDRHQVQADDQDDGVRDSA